MQDCLIGSKRVWPLVCTSDVGQVTILSLGLLGLVFVLNYGKCSRADVGISGFVWPVADVIMICYDIMMIL